MIVLAAISLAVWVYLLLAHGGFWRMSAAPAQRRARASVVAVIPARDEAAVVGTAVASLTPQLPVVVVDDSSSDGTAMVARSVGAHVIEAGLLPPGWTGKLWAVTEGLRAAAPRDPEYWLLTDADIVHAPDSVAGLVGRARAGNYDLVSYMVLLECRTMAEQALIPAFVFFFFMLYPPAWIRDPRRRTAGAAGGCMLVRRDALERIGGIERIRGERIDDCALAREIKRAGGKVWLGLTRETRSIRSYGSFDEIGRMISRTAFTQLRHSWWLLAGTVAGLILTYLVPPLLALLSPPGATRGMAALAWLAMSIAYFPAVRFYGRPWWWAPMLPAIAVFYLGATLHSAFFGSTWKGRRET